MAPPSSKTQNPRKNSKDVRQRGSIPVSDRKEDDSSDREEDVLTCTKCKSDFRDPNDKLIQCERCDKWFCVTCLKMEDTHYSLISQRPDMHWYCQECEKKALEAVKNEKSIEERCDYYLKKMEDRMVKLEDAMLSKADKAEIDNIDVKVLALEIRLQGISSDTAKIAKKQQLQETEDEERSKRKKNLILKGIPENPQIPDRDQVVELMEALNFQANDISKIHGRLGKVRTDGKPRFLKVEYKEEEMKKKILSKAVKIRDIPNLSYDKLSVFISPDMTQIQRERDIELRKELKQKRINDPNGQWIIRGQKVVKKVGTPPSAPPET